MKYKLNKIKKIKKNQKGGDETTCPICLEDWNEETENGPKIDLMCGNNHYGHVECIYKWSGSNPRQGKLGPRRTCPECRQPIDLVLYKIHIIKLTRGERFQELMRHIQEEIPQAYHLDIKSKFYITYILLIALIELEVEGRKSGEDKEFVVKDIFMNQNILNYFPNIEPDVLQYIQVGNVGSYQFKESLFKHPIFKLCNKVNGFDLSDLQLGPQNFTEFNLDHFNFSNSYLGGSTWGGHPSPAKQSSFQNCNFSGCNLVSADFTGVGGFGADCSESNFTGAIFDDVQMESTNFKNCNFSDTIFEGSDLHLADFEGSNFSNSIFKNCKADEANFSETTSEEAKMERVNFDHSDFTDSYFGNCHFKGINFTNGDFKNTQFNGSYFGNCNFNNSNIIDTNFSSAHFYKNTFNGAIQENVNFNDVTEHHVEPFRFRGGKKKKKTKRKKKKIKKTIKKRKKNN